MLALVRLLAPILDKRAPFTLWLEAFENEISTVFLVDPYLRRMIKVREFYGVMYLSQSPNQRYIAYIQIDRSEQGYIAPFIFDQTSQENILVQYDGGTDPLFWSPDSSTLFYWAYASNGSYQPYQFDLNTRTIQTIAASDLEGRLFVEAVNPQSSVLQTQMRRSGYGEFSNLLQVSDDSFFFGAMVYDTQTRERQHYLVGIDNEGREFSRIALSGVPSRLFLLPDS